MTAQLQANRAAAAARISEGHGISDSAVLKPAYSEMCKHARPGDDFIVWRLGRLSRSHITLIELGGCSSAWGVSRKALRQSVVTVF
ncbi:recombinase family protein [Novosphingobium sp. PY1]|uniref:recombinase family protein n=1 Tax=Novosphingobium sp. PY1 TaxID=1882221 RepID=UPI0021131F99|nr:recombinase family protein [Novosphingobium sp. PY1]